MASVGSVAALAALLWTVAALPAEEIVAADAEAAPVAAVAALTSRLAETVTN